MTIQDDNLAYQWMSTAQQMGFNCREILSRFKKTLFRGYIYFNNVSICGKFSSTGCRRSLRR